MRAWQLKIQIFHIKNFYNRNKNNQFYNALFYVTFKNAAIHQINTYCSIHFQQLISRCNQQNIADCCRQPSHKAREIYGHHSRSALQLPQQPATKRGAAILPSYFLQNTAQPTAPPAAACRPVAHRQVQARRQRHN